MDNLKHPVQPVLLIQLRAFPAGWEHPQTTNERGEVVLLPQAEGFDEQRMLINLQKKALKHNLVLDGDHWTPRIPGINDDWARDFEADIPMHVLPEDYMPSLDGVTQLQYAFYATEDGELGHPITEAFDTIQEAADFLYQNDFCETLEQAMDEVISQMNGSPSALLRRMLAGLPDPASLDSPKVLVGVTTLQDDAIGYANNSLLELELSEPTLKHLQSGLQSVHDLDMEAVRFDGQGYDSLCTVTGDLTGNGSLMIQRDGTIKITLSTTDPDGDCVIVEPATELNLVSLADHLKEARKQGCPILVLNSNEVMYFKKSPYGQQVTDAPEAPAVVVPLHPWTENNTQIKETEPGAF